MYIVNRKNQYKHQEDNVMHPIRYLKIRNVRLNHGRHARFKRKQHSILFHKYTSPSGPRIKARQKKLCNPNHPIHSCDSCSVKSFQTQMNTTHPMIMDAESYLIAIDNHSSCCVTNNVYDFIHPITSKKIKVKGLQG